MRMARQLPLPSAYGYKQPSPTFQPSLEPGNESKTGYLRPTTSQAATTATTAKMKARTRLATMTVAIGNRRKRLGMCHLFFFSFFLFFFDNVFRGVVFILLLSTLPLEGPTLLRRRLSLLYGVGPCSGRSSPPTTAYPSL